MVLFPNASADIFKTEIEFFCIAFFSQTYREWRSIGRNEETENEKKEKYKKRRRAIKEDERPSEMERSRGMGKHLKKKDKT